MFYETIYDSHFYILIIRYFAGFVSRLVEPGQADFFSGKTSRKFRIPVSERVSGNQTQYSRRRNKLRTLFPIQK